MQDVLMRDPTPIPRRKQRKVEHERRRGAPVLLVRPREPPQALAEHVVVAPPDAARLHVPHARAERGVQHALDQRHVVRGHDEPAVEVCAPRVRGSLLACVPGAPVLASLGDEPVELV